MFRAAGQGAGNPDGTHRLPPHATRREAIPTRPRFALEHLGLLDYWISVVTRGEM